jgi:hypothetical protein
MLMKRTLTLLTALFCAAPAAQAAGVQAKTMRETLSAREVERGLLIGKGWFEVGLGTDIKKADGYWSAEGEPVDWDNARWTWSTQRASFRYGLTKRSELFGTVKWHYARLQNEALDTDVSDFGLGDPTFGYKFEWFKSLAPVTSLISYVQYKGPAGNESPGNYIGGPSTFSSVIMTTGTPDLEFGARGKRQIGPVGITVGGAYVRRFSNVVQYVVETDFNVFNGRIKPGDITKVDGELLLQLGPVALQGGGMVQMRKATEIGPTSAGLFQAADLEAQEGSDGVYVDANAGFTFNITRGVDLVGGVSIPVKGEDLMYFPIEDLHPTRGNTYSGTIEFRY